MTQVRRRLPRIRAWFTPLNVVQLLAAALVVACMVGTVLQPVDPYHRAALTTLRSSLAELPPYPGSVAGKPEIKAGPVDLETILLINYGTTAACTDVQTYYATTAAAAGWQVERPVVTIHMDAPPADVLHGSYRKQEQGFEVELIIECFVDSAVQSGYTFDLHTPPDPASSAVRAQDAQLASLRAGATTRRQASTGWTPAGSGS